MKYSKMILKLTRAISAEYANVNKVEALQDMKRIRFNYGTPKNQLKILRKWCSI